MISKEEASCIFFNEKISKDNALLCLSKINRMEEVELCYSSNPRRPLLQSEAIIYGNPESYHVYLTEEELNQQEITSAYRREEIITFETKAQLLEFINYVYQPVEEDDQNKIDYAQDSISINDVFGVIVRYSEEFKSAESFATWCSASKANFMSVEPTRKSVKTEKGGQKVRFRVLNVLNNKYHDKVAKQISSTLEDHKAYIQKLKNEGFKIIGYCRNSNSKRNEKTIKLLQQMVDDLYKRSLVDFVFVSPCCNANIPFFNRDLKTNAKIFSALENIHGDSKDMLNFISDKKNICIVCLDYAGLTINTLDLKDVLRNNENIKKIVVDMFFSENHFHKLEVNDLLDDKEIFNEFECKTSCKQRAK